MTPKHKWHFVYAGLASFLVLYVGAYVALRECGRQTTGPRVGFRYSNGVRANLAAGFFFYPVYKVDEHLFGTVWFKRRPLQSLTSVLDGSAQPAVYQPRYRDVPFSAVSDMLSGALWATSGITVSQTKAASSQTDEDGHRILITRFSIAEGDLEKFAAVLEMRRAMSQDRLSQALVDYRLSQYTVNAPTWFGPRPAGGARISGEAHKKEYELTLVGAAGADEEIEIYAQVIVWPASAPDASQSPSWIFWAE